MGLSFEWDAGKAASNLAKHRFAFEDAIQVFGDTRIVIFPTIRAGDGEERWKAVGRIGQYAFTVVYTMRGEVVRLISARRANSAEEKQYDRRP